MRQDGEVSCVHRLWAFALPPASGRRRNLYGYLHVRRQRVPGCRFLQRQGNHGKRGTWYFLSSNGDIENNNYKSNLSLFIRLARSIPTAPLVTSWKGVREIGPGFRMVPGGSACTSLDFFEGIWLPPRFFGVSPH